MRKQYVRPRDEYIREQEEKKTHISNKPDQRKVIVFGSIAIVIVLVFVSIRAFSIKEHSGSWDNFALCLTDKGAVMFGNIQTCRYSQHQGGMFGSSFKYINYEHFTENPDVKVTPTWYINGKKLEGEQSFETL